MLVAAVRFGVDLRRVVHEAGGVERVRLREQGVVRGLSVIAVFVALRREFVIVGRRTMVFGGAQMRRNCRVRRHTVRRKTSFALLQLVMGTPCGSCITSTKRNCVDPVRPPADRSN